MYKEDVGLLREMDEVWVPDGEKRSSSATESRRIRSRLSGGSF
jgi:hypothetical protein